jgi:large subunit ribosomal protein L31
VKKDIHPTDYRTVVFEDLSNGFTFLSKSTAKTTETTKWTDGKEYPVIKVHISSASHPFYTGDEKLLDIEGRVDKFKARAEAGAKAKAAKLAATKKPAKAQKEAVKLGDKTAA